MRPSAFLVTLVTPTETPSTAPAEPAALAFSGLPQQARTTADSS